MDTKSMATTPAHAHRHSHGRTATASTSIRVSVETRDALAVEAQARGLTVTGYLGEVAREAERRRAFADFRDALQVACDDPAFVAEIREWDDMDDGVAPDGSTQANADHE
jgi:hypothetical protein